MVLMLWTFIAVDAIKTSHHLLELSRFSDLEAAAPVPSRGSPTGYDEGLRWLFLGSHTDAYHWIMQAEATASGEGIRLRSVQYDNAPEGRDVHWALPHRLWLAGLGYAIRLVRPEPLGIAIEQAALWDGPVLYAVFGALLILLVARKYSLPAGGIALCGLVGSGFLRDNFDAGNADHHGMLAASAMLMLLALHRGFRGTDVGIAAPGPLRARGRDWGRGWMIAAGLCGGFGMWVSAATVIPVIVAVFAGAVAGQVIWPERSHAAADARRWRAWGFAGALTSLAGYLLEYFPSHMALRLEVNHPAYAAAWAGAAELLALWIESSPGNRRLAGARLFRGILAAAAALFLPALFLATHDRSFLVGNRFVWTLHRDYISEFQTLGQYLSHHRVDAGFACAAIAWLCPLVFGIHAVIGRVPADAGRRLLVLTAPTVAFAALAALEVRWLSVLCAANLCLLIAWSDETSRFGGAPGRRRARWSLIIAGVLLLPGLAQAMVELAAPDPKFTREDLTRLAERNLAYRLRQRIGADPSAVVLTTPEVTSAFAYFAGLRGLGTLYWENYAGLRKAAEIYSAPSMGEARRLIAKYGVTQIVVVSWDGFEPAYVQLARNLPKGTPLPEDTFIYQLIQRHVVPSWLRRVPYRLPDHPAFENERVLIFDVGEDQPADLRLVDEVEWMLESGASREAQAHENDLRSMSNSLPALVTLGRLLGPARAQVEVMPAIETMEPSAGHLRAVDRIRLALLSAQTGRLAIARRELDFSYAQLDENSVRKLPPEILAVLPRLADALHDPLPDGRLAELVRSLIPPYLQRSDTP